MKSLMTYQKIIINRLVRQLTPVVFFVLAMIISGLAPAETAAPGGLSFNHNTTGFFLDGAHAGKVANPATPRDCSAVLPAIAQPVTAPVGGRPGRRRRMFLPQRPATPATIKSAGHPAVSSTGQPRGWFRGHAIPAITAVLPQASPPDICRRTHLAIRAIKARPGCPPDIPTPWLLRAPAHPAITELAPPASRLLTFPPRLPAIPAMLPGWLLRRSPLASAECMPT